MVRYVLLEVYDCVATLRHLQPVNDHIGDVKARIKAQTSEHSQAPKHIKLNPLTIAPSGVVFELCPRIH
jgi:hypothetical protein